MLQSFVVALREGVEAALIVAIVLAYLAKIGKPDLRKLVYAGLAAAGAGSAGLALLLVRLNWNEEAVEGWIMLVAAFFVVTMAVYMMRAARGLKRHIETRVDTLASRGSQIGLFIFVLLMVLREGVETVLILSAVSLNSTALASALGTVAGITGAVLFGVILVRGSMRVNLQKFFRVTTVILFIVAAQLVFAGIHELEEAGVFPGSPELTAIIAPIVRYETVLFLTAVALSSFLLLNKRRKAAVVVTAPIPEERRAARAAQAGD